MNREAAALGVPVYSIFRGEIGAVDRYLSQNDRLVMIETIEDVQQNIPLIKRMRLNEGEFADRSALQVIVNGIATAMAGQLAAESSNRLFNSQGLK